MTAPLGASSAEISCARPEELAPEQIVALERALSHGEIERAARFHLDEARRGFVVARALLRRSLSRRVRRVLGAEIPASAWRFTANPHGKPLLAAPRTGIDLHFNVSHTSGLCVCIVAASEVGIDVQHTGRPPPWRVLERYLAPSERERLQTSPEPERADRFFEHWTLKEAYVKARGLGFALPLSQIGFAIDGAEARLLLGPEIDDDPGRWSLKTWRARPEHQVAIAIERSSATSLGAAREAEDPPPVLRHEGFAEPS